MAALSSMTFVLVVMVVVVGGGGGAPSAILRPRTVSGRL